MSSLYSWAAAVALMMAVGSAVPAEDRPAYRILGADQGKVAIVDSQGNVEWEFVNKVECHDLWLLPNGNILLANGRAKVSEFTPDKKIVWSYEARPKPGYSGRVEVHAFQRLTMVGRWLPNRAMPVWSRWMRPARS